MEIAHASEGNCVGRAISTMRLALGYEQGLPEGWYSGFKTTLELVSLLDVSFPDRKVLVACPIREMKGTTLTGQVKWVGPAMNFGELQHQVNPDSYLMAFSYGEPGTGKGHVVIGTPCRSGLLDVLLIIAVSLKRGGDMAKNDRRLAWQHVKSAAGDFKSAVQFRNSWWLRTGWSQLKIARHLLGMSMKKDVAVSLE